MSLTDQIVNAVEVLPQEHKLQVLNYARSLVRAEAAEPRRPRKSLLGALAHLNVSVTREDIDEARREMWGNFPRGDI